MRSFPNLTLFYTLHHSASVSTVPDEGKVRKLFGAVRAARNWAIAAYQKNKKVTKQEVIRSFRESNPWSIVLPQAVLWAAIDQQLKLCAKNKETEFLPADSVKSFAVMPELVFLVWSETGKVGFRMCVEYFGSETIFPTSCPLSNEFFEREENGSIHPKYHLSLLLSVRVCVTLQSVWTLSLSSPPFHTRTVYIFNV